MSFKLFCFLLGVLITGISGWFAHKCEQKNDRAGSYLRNIFLLIAVVSVSYLISVQMQNKFLFGLFSAVYYCGIDLMLYSLLLYTCDVVKLDINKGKLKIAKTVVFSIVVLDIILELASPMVGYLAIDYSVSNALIPPYEYEFKLLYYCHLGICYSLIIAFTVLFIGKSIIVPKEYRFQYILSLVGLFAIVVVNATFLFIPKKSIYNRLDYSIVGYCIVGLFMYWTYYSYASVGMMSQFKSYVFSNIDQGILLFDFENNLILWNSRAIEMLPGFKFQRFNGLEGFTKYCKLEISNDPQVESRTYQCFIEAGGTSHALRCDYQVVENKHEQMLGRLFVFSDVTRDTDLLTGFHSWERFLLFLKENEKDNLASAVVSVCDINGLAIINNAFGREEGDKKIQQLATELKNELPSTSYFARGPEANLIAITVSHTKEDIVERLHRIESRIDINIQFAVAVTTSSDPSVIKAIKRAIGAMKNLKLLDRASSHSGTLSSLITALQEADNDTESHVQRTRKIGLELGKRIGLTDLEMSQLSLLCLMHDIGKIGVPLEILNKPGKLTEAEFTVLRSHVKKGYEICKSSPELCEIADMVLHHHERWDGRGYPDGASKETIPLLSRIIAVVDAYDAMVNERVYSPAMPEETAQAELTRCAGTQFDPVIVSEFLRLMKEREFYSKEFKIEAKNETPHENSVPSNDADVCVSTNVHKVDYSSYILDSSSRIISIDSRFESLTGYSMDYIKATGMTQLDLIPPEDRPEYLFSLNSEISRNQEAFFEHRIVTKNGTKLYVFCFGRNFYDSAEKDMHTQIIIADSMQTYSVQVLVNHEQDKSIKRLQQWEDSYRRDSLTGLLKREAFRSDVELQLINENAKVLLLMLDVDHFKQYNDAYGHHAGDDLLVLLSKSLQKQLRNEDLACRMGGDEFSAAIVFSTTNSDEQIYRRARQIFDSVTEGIADSKYPATISMGAVIARHGDSFNSIYESSDSALYQSKNNGRGCLTIEDDSIIQ